MAQERAPLLMQNWFLKLSCSALLSSGLVIGAWSFSGAWCLEFGAFTRDGSIENSGEPGHTPPDANFHF
jgi:hypothetical protein